MNILKQIIKYFGYLAEIAVVGGLVFLAIFLLRYQMITEMGMTWAQAQQGEINYGLQYDFALILSAAVIVLALYAVTFVPMKISALVLGWFIYIGNLANLLYFKYFGQRLDWWLVKTHILDVPSVLDSAGVLFLDKNTILSLVSMVVMTAFLLLVSHYQKKPSLFRRRWLNIVVAHHLPALLLAVGLSFLALNWWGYWKSYQRTGILSSQIVKLWADQIAGKQLFAQKTDSSFVWDSKVNLMSQMKEPGKDMADYFQELDQILDGYTDWQDSATDWPLEPRLVPAGNKAYPLLKKVEADLEFSRQMKQKLGLPLDKNPNVIFLFVESFRSYEFLHEEIGPAIFPNLRTIFANHAINFSSAYSSSWTSGQTARGNFSAQCSMLPNNNGAATYIAYSTLRIKCIQQFLKEHGYYTLWTSGTGSKFHNMGMFERLHGMDNFVEEGYYRRKGVKSMKPGWGLKDYEMLAESVKLLNEKARQSQKPLYVNLATLSTHHPQSVLPGFEIPEQIKAKYIKGNYNYEKHLSRFKYEDAALGNFFQKLFDSPIGDNTLVVLLGDHATPVKGEDRSDLLNLQERHFRIALALVTKNMVQPANIDWPVHQIDIVPTVAHILGFEGETSWMGRGLFSRPGSAWIYAFNGSANQFRIGQHACYKVSGKKACYNVRGIDPLFETVPKNELAPEDTAMLDKVIEYFSAEMAGIVQNKIYPANK